MMLLSENLTFNGSQVCQFGGHHSIVIGDRIYVDGGMFIAKDGFDPNLSYRDLRIYDLSQISQQTIGDSVFSIPQRTVVERPGSIINTRKGYLWTDEEQRILYKYGGNLIDPPDVLRNMTDYALRSGLVHFDTQFPDVNSPSAWESVPNTAPPVISRLAFGAGARSLEKTQGYYLGGFDDLVGNDHMSAETERASVRDNLVLWDGIQQTFTNETVRQNASSTDSFNAGAGGALFHLPLGTGMLVSLGGREFEGNAIRFAMDRIRLYDIANGTWYTQTAIGDVPDARNDFCGVMTPANDNSSYNIYISGGQTGPNSGADDVYVLSLPSFHWFKAYSGTDVPRTHHSCEIVHDRQMAIIGGYNATALTTQECGEEMGGDLRIFDMSTLDFADYDSTKTSYNIPPSIYSVIGGNGNGGSQVQKPAAGWTDPLLETAFSAAAGKTIPTATESPTGKPGTPAAPSRRQLAGAISGGVIGGICLVTLVLVLWHFCRGRRNGRKTPIRVLHGDSDEGFRARSAASSPRWPARSSRVQVPDMPRVYTRMPSSTSHGTWNDTHSSPVMRSTVSPVSPATHTSVGRDRSTRSRHRSILPSYSVQQPHDAWVESPPPPPPLPPPPPVLHELSATKSYGGTVSTAERWELGQRSPPLHPKALEAASGGFI
ncbi:MAG: hypothetical protein M1833_003857 [Piccolia ochrophora]|nr:MAG: hypothetical protein M1833_003857 [Piccolia ochrophora]